jgi:hypothetical protein
LPSKRSIDPERAPCPPSGKSVAIKTRIPAAGKPGADREGRTVRAGQRRPAR